MFERLTYSAWITRPLANEVALRFHHEAVGPEHIMWGLMKQRSGVALTTLRNFGLTPPGLCSQVERLLKMSPDKGCRGKLPQTPEAEALFRRAIEEADACNAEHVDTGHSLLNLLREDSAIVNQVVTSLGLELEDVRQEVLNVRAAGVEDQLFVTTVCQQTCANKSQGKPKVVYYKELPVWQRTDELAVQVYAVADRFPPGKIPAVMSRLREIALTIPPHIAAVHEHRATPERRLSLKIAFGSIRQLRYLLEFAQRLGCLDGQDYQRLDGLAGEVDRTLRSA